MGPIRPTNTRRRHRLRPISPCLLMMLSDRRNTIRMPNPPPTETLPATPARKMSTEASEEDDLLTLHASPLPTTPEHPPYPEVPEWRANWTSWCRPPRISTSSSPPLSIDFKVPTTPPRRLDAARIVQELSTMPALLSPLPVTPDKASKPSPVDSSDWLNLDTSPLPITPEKANTPSPRRDLYAPRLRELAPAPVLTESKNKTRMYQLFGSASPPTPTRQATPAPTSPPQPVLVRIPLEALRPKNSKTHKRYRLSIPDETGGRPLWITIPPRNASRATNTVTVPAAFAKTIGQ